MDVRRKLSSILYTNLLFKLQENHRTAGEADRSAKKRKSLINHGKRETTQQRAVTPNLCNKTTYTQERKPVEH